MKRNLFRIIGILLACMGVMILTASQHISSRFDARPAIAAMTRRGIINDRESWQRIRKQTDNGRQITSVTQLSRLLQRANRHSFAVSSIKQVEHHQLPSLVRNQRLNIINVPAFFSQQRPVQKRYWQRLQTLLKQASPASQLILNFAGNTGGLAEPMIAGLAAIIPDGTLYIGLDNHGRTFPRTLHHGHLSNNLGQEALTFQPPKPLHFKHITVIVGEQTASAAEITLMALKRNPHVTLVGHPTAGYTSLNSGVYLNTGAAAVLTIGTLRSTVKIHGQQFFNNQPLIPDVTTLYQPLAPARTGHHQQSGQLDPDFISELQTIARSHDS
ncbi:carboxyterminal processing proteinase, S41 family, membrane-anchored [Lactiplantibacillus pentosus KCA1]|nr:S41 family peptidase [Lactiplantibacillus pentosus]EIW14202.1 carboxyterminal processing proteinase, S41 family, membrane-anchored [Lactiplantibacillus pentosus KCA1]